MERFNISMVYLSNLKYFYMKKIAVIVFTIISQVFFAQATRFVYLVTMKQDSTNLTDIKTENAFLDIDGKKSFFYPEKALKRDSIFSRMRQTKSFNFDRNQMQSLRSNIDFTVEKDFKTGTKIFKSRIARDTYSYDEDRPMVWKILPETTKIEEYKVQKAETDFAGRKWYAWFTMDIPFQDGPYKFSGLPGLIVKVEDAKGDYSFDLKETKKIAEIKNFEQFGRLINVQRKDFEKQNTLFRKDPASFIQSSMMGTERGGFGGGMQTDPNERKKREERMKEEIRKNNNPIELK